MLDSEEFNRNRAFGVMKKQEVLEQLEKGLLLASQLKFMLSTKTFPIDSESKADIEKFAKSVEECQNKVVELGNVLINLKQTIDQFLV